MSGPDTIHASAPTTARRVLAVLATAAALAACGGDSGAATGGAATGPAASATVRIDLAPNPIWEWIEGSGGLSRWSQLHDIRAEVTNSFDQFAAFGSGHADIVVTSALEVGSFVQDSEREPLIVGKLTTDRSILAVSRSTRTVDTLEDLVDRRIAVENSLGSELLWGVISEALYGLEFEDGGSDFDLVLVDPASVADLVLRGDVDGCICLPDYSAPYLADGRLVPLYGGRSAAEIYAQEVLEDTDPDALPMHLVFIVDKDWLEANLVIVEHVFELWEAGLRQWASGRGQIVSDFRHLFSAQTVEEIDWMTRHLNDHDWMAPSVYLKESDVGNFAEVQFRVKRAGLIPADAVEPGMRVLQFHSHDEDEHEEEHGEEEDEHEDEHEEEQGEDGEEHGEDEHEEEQGEDGEATGMGERAA